MGGSSEQAKPHSGGGKGGLGAQGTCNLKYGLLLLPSIPAAQEKPVLQKLKQEMQVDGSLFQHEPMPPTCPCTRAHGRLSRKTRWQPWAGETRVQFPFQPEACLSTSKQAHLCLCSAGCKTGMRQLPEPSHSLTCRSLSKAL